MTPVAIENVLAEFRSWLQHLSSAAPADQEDGEETEPVDLHTLLGQFVALRHEVNLHTKAARSGQEQTSQALQQLGQALEALRQAQAAAQQSKQQMQEEALRPLLKTLLDVREAFSLGAREIQRAQETILPLVDELAVEAPASGNGSWPTEGQLLKLPATVVEPELDMEPAAVPEAEPKPRPKRSLWQRLLPRARNQERSRVCEIQTEALAQWHAQQQRLRAKLQEQRAALLAQHEQYEQLLKHQREQQRREQAAQQEHQDKIERVAQRLDELLDGVTTGYQMSLQRLERALAQSGLEPIPCVGEPFDPEQMEVVAAVTDSGRPAGEVIEEVRRGYRWRGRVFRYAQVSVAKS